MERAYPGFVAFVPVFPVRPGQKPLDLGQLISAVRAVKDPGPAPDLTAMMPPVVGQPPNSKWADMRRRRFYRWVGGVIGVTIALFLLTVEPFGPLLALVAITISALVAFLPSAEMKGELNKLKTAKEAWNDVGRDFEQSAGNSNFLLLRNEAETLIARLQQLNSEEALRLAELTKRKKDLQLRHFLEQHDIDQLKIKGIGNARKRTLKSYGIETTADIEYHRILAISGFGPATANILVDWRRRIEARFHFNPSQSVDPADANAIKMEFANKRADIEARAQQTLDKLQKAAVGASATRASPGSQASEAWIALKHAQEFESELRPSAREVVKLAGVGTVSAISLVAYSNLIVLVPPYLFGRQKQHEVVISPQPREVELPSSDGRPITPQPGSPTSPKTAPSSPAGQPAQPTRPSEAAPPSPESPSAEGTEGAKPVPVVPSGIVPVAPPKETTLASGTVADATSSAATMRRRRRNQGDSRPMARAE
jgi:hypothetical protein